MKHLLILSSILLLVACQPTTEDNTTAESTATFVPAPQDVPEQEVTTLPIGATAPDFTLPDIDGNMVSLSDFDGSDVLVILFTCAHCPTAQAYEDRIIAFTDSYQDKSVQMVAIMPNSSQGLLLEELGYSDLGDTFEEMKIRAEDKGYNFPFLYDGDDHAVSLQYGPVATPHVYVFDKERALRYRGNIDQKEKPGTGNSENLIAAVEALLTGQDVATPETKSFGCSIKWAWKNEYAKKVNKEWNEKDVTLEPLSAEGIDTLMDNNSDKLRLVNIWATWCGPCIIEYPDFVDIQRMYGARSFEFVSLSADKPEKADDAQAFLKKSHSALRNYIYAEDDKYKLIENVDPDWNGALPYTVLIEPGGNVAFRHQGAVDLMELKQAIVDHEMMGRYY